MMTNVEYALAGSLLLMVVVNIALLVTLTYLNTRLTELKTQLAAHDEELRTPNNKNHPIHPDNPPPGE